DVHGAGDVDHGLRVELDLLVAGIDRVLGAVAAVEDDGGQRQGAVDGERVLLRGLSLAGHRSAALLTALLTAASPAGAGGEHGGAGTGAGDGQETAARGADPLERSQVVSVHAHGKPLSSLKASDDPVGARRMV